MGIQPLDNETTEQYDAFLTYMRLHVYERKSTTDAVQYISVGFSKTERTVWGWKAAYQWDTRLNVYRCRLVEKELVERFVKELKLRDKFFKHLTPENAAEMMRISNDFIIAVIGSKGNDGEGIACGNHDMRGIKKGECPSDSQT